MSQAEELLNSLSAGDTTETATEGHIVIGNDRFITVPEELKRIGVQYDHNIETVTFDCPRYWDGLDMSQMVVYINYMLPDRTKGSYIADNVTADDTDDTIMHFDWTISRNVTQVKGAIFFLVCIKKTDENGDEVNHWNSELCKDIYISEGLECGEPIAEAYPDIITSLLERMDAVENITVDVNTNEIATFKECETNYNNSVDHTVVAFDTNNLVAVKAYGQGIITLYYNDTSIGDRAWPSSYYMTKNINSIYDLIYVNDMFIGVGENGCIIYGYYNELISTDETGSITSINPNNWTEITVGDKDFKGIAYGNGTIVTIGDGGTLAYSTNGVEWTNKILFGGNTDFETIYYDGTKFIALGHGTINAYSEDGITWSTNSNLVISATDIIYDVIYANNKYVAVGSNGIILYSDDAISWISGVSDNINDLHSVTYANGKFVAVGKYTDPNSGSAPIATIIYSEDGINWTIADNTFYQADLYTVLYIKNHFVTIYGKKTFTSDDGIAWSNIREDNFSTSISHIAYCNGRFVASMYFSPFCLYSYDGVNWFRYLKTVVPDNVLFSDIDDIISLDNIFIGFSGGISRSYYSSNGLDWAIGGSTGVRMSPYSAPYYLRYAFGNNKLVICTSKGISCTEDNGKTWNSFTFGDGTVINDIAYNNRLFVGVGKNGTNGVIAYSEDGLNWSTTTIDFILSRIAYGNGKFVATERYLSAYSEDGINWTKVDNDVISSAPTHLLYENNQYICFNSYAKYIYYSLDGINWTKVVFDIHINDITYGKGKFICTGDTNSGLCYSVYKTEQKALSDAINELYASLEKMSAVESSLSLPIVSATDNGKFLRVIDGVWTAASLTDVSEVGA